MYVWIVLEISHELPFEFGGEKMEWVGNIANVANIVYQRDSKALYIVLQTCHSAKSQLDPRYIVAHIAGRES